MDSSPDLVQRQVPADPSPEARSRRLQVLAIDLEFATRELVASWLAEEGWELGLDARPGDPIALVLVEMAYPRHAERERLRAFAEVWPGVPVLLLSPTFFADVPSCGALARQLGVAAVLATPLARDSFLDVLRGALGAAR